MCAFLSHRLDVNIHTSSFSLFVLRTQGKLETGKAMGFKEEENNSMISLPLTQGILPEGHGLKYGYQGQSFYDYRRLEMAFLLKGTFPIEVLM